MIFFHGESKWKPELRLQRSRGHPRSLTADAQSGAKQRSQE